MIQDFYEEERLERLQDWMNQEIIDIFSYTKGAA
jgi:hypothetical protein